VTAAFAIAAERCSRKRLCPQFGLGQFDLHRPTVSEEDPFRLQYLMPTPKGRETPGTPPGSQRPSRDASPTEEGRLSAKHPQL